VREITGYQWASFVRRLGRLVARHHRLHAIRAGVAPIADRIARRQSGNALSAAGRRPDHHDWFVGLGRSAALFSASSPITSAGWRTLALSILIYSVFTALQGFAQEAWQLGLFRFIAGLGTGAELMIAIPLVAEAFAETHRAKVSAS